MKWMKGICSLCFVGLILLGLPNQAAADLSTYTATWTIPNSSNTNANDFHVVLDFPGGVGPTFTSHDPFQDVDWDVAGTAPGTQITIDWSNPSSVIGIGDSVTFDFSVRIDPANAGGLKVRDAYWTYDGVMTNGDQPDRDKLAFVPLPSGVILALFGVGTANVLLRRKQST